MSISVAIIFFSSFVGDFNSAIGMIFCNSNRYRTYDRFSSLKTSACPSRPAGSSIFVSGKPNWFTKSLVAKDGDWNFPALVAEVTELRRSWPDTQGMILNADNEVQYGEVVRAMEALKTHIPAVLLRGL